MLKIPLEDSFSDIARKTQRGLKLSDEELLRQSGASAQGWETIKEGKLDEDALRKVAKPLNLHAGSLLALARQEWYPQAQAIEGLAAFNTTFEDMTVNAYLVWDPRSKEAAVFDTGADASGILKTVRENNLVVKYILLTHTHPDHVADLERLRKETGAPCFVSRQEPVPGAELIGEGVSFSLTNVKIDSRSTTGHSVGGITYVVTGLSKPVAVVGDAMFAGSMGGGIISFDDAIQNNRKKILTLSDETILCPGHGPLTTVGEEKAHNPFFPEFKK